MTDLGDIGPDPRWSTFMVSTIPECVAVCDLVLQRSDEPNCVDRARLVEAISDATWNMLEEWTTGRTDVTWVALQRMQGVPDFDHCRLGAYLSTKGAIGVALSDKLRFHLLYILPQHLAKLVGEGAFHR